VTRGPWSATATGNAGLVAFGATYAVSASAFQGSVEGMHLGTATVEVAPTAYVTIAPLVFLP
jgi:hypothetical protein